jgi:hypothetical protein
MLGLTVVVTALAFASTAAAQAPWMRWRPSPSWMRAALCIHAHESTNWHLVNAPYFGGMQFLLSTWYRAGGSGGSLWAAARSSPREQLYRAWKVWLQDGGSWREWPTTSRICGV